MVFLVQVESAKLYGKSAHTTYCRFYILHTQHTECRFITPCNFVIEVSIELSTIVSDIFKWASIGKLQDLEPLRKQCTAMWL